MLSLFKEDGWKVEEIGFHPEYNRFAESIFSLGNEHMGLRGFFEETYSGDSLHGIYLAGVYYPDKTKVGWWKIGYPEFFAKVVNSINWIGVDIGLDGNILDLAKMKFRDFKRTLDMKSGSLSRSFTVTDESGKLTGFEFERFLSMADNNIACLSVKVKPLNYSGRLALTAYLDGDVSNEDSNYGEKFWIEEGRRAEKDFICLNMRTKKTAFLESAAAKIRILSGGEEISTPMEPVSREKYAGLKTYMDMKEGSVIELQKFVAVCTSRDFRDNEVENQAGIRLEKAFMKGYAGLREEHIAEMNEKWEDSDVVIEGDIKAQQGIRYNIFQMNQTYTGKDPRLNIGPKGFTGEKYGGSTYWDTEAFCLPFYLYTRSDVARNLLYYRYLHLEKARENASLLGMKGALYPMVTIDGRECHNEWEITFEEIHRNGAIAYAIYNYTRFTGDETYLFEYGLEVLIEISRYWASRVNYNGFKDSYMILGVTGPNEYENNVNNNWYTNTLAKWTLSYTLESIEKLRDIGKGKLSDLIGKLKLENAETDKWKEIIEKMYFPYVESLGIFEQNDLYMDKEQLTVADLSEHDMPINKHWSWDRILRSCFIKQADVIQGIYFFPENWDRDTVKRNFDFYEPRTVHESSLSPCVYSVVASRIGYREKAYELYLRTSRLDLDNYNNDTDDGVHLTSMAGSWLAVVEGFAGLSVRHGVLELEPSIPDKWKAYSFKFCFRNRKLKVSVVKGRASFEQISGEPLKLNISGREYETREGSAVNVKL